MDIESFLEHFRKERDKQQKRDEIKAKSIQEWLLNYDQEKSKKSFFKGYKPQFYFRTKEIDLQKDISIR